MCQEEASCLSISCLKRVEPFQPKWGEQGSISLRSLKPRGMTFSQQHNSRCGKSQPGKSQTMSLIFPPIRAFSRQRINPGVCKVGRLKQTYYGSRGEEGPRISSFADHCLEAKGGRLCCGQQHSSLLHLYSSAGWQCFRDISNPAILPVCLVSCFPIVVEESCCHPAGISLVSKGHSARISVSLWCQKRMNLWKVTTRCREAGGHLPSIPYKNRLVTLHHSFLMPCKLVSPQSQLGAQRFW